MPYIDAFVKAKYYTLNGRDPKKVYGAVYHMAQGGGTVSWLTHPSNDNSSTLVVEYSGRVVQMVRTVDMDHSLYVNYDSDTRDAPDYDTFALRHAQEVLAPAVGATLSNSERVLPYLVSVEVEGFAAEGPNSKQIAALRDKVAPWIKQQFPNIRGALGHRDFQDYKPCPGGKFPWAQVGGHGLWVPQEDTYMQSFTWDEKTAKLGWIKLKNPNVHFYLRLLTGTLHGPLATFDKRAFGPVRLLKGIGDNTDARSIGYIVPDEAAFILDTDVIFTADTVPAPPDNTAVKNSIKTKATEIASLVTQIK